MSKKALAALIGVLGVLCVACGVFLLTSRSQPATADPTPQASPTVKPTAVPTASPTEPPESSQPEATEEPYVSPIDFEALQGQNPDIYGWLRIPNTEFDFPLVQRQGDDSFYLTHNSDGEEDPAGAIFTESAYNSADMEDPVTVAYGHQMIAGTMFGKLQETYSQENALEDYGEIIVYLPEKELHYQVFAAVPYDNRHILYNYDCTDSRRFNAFLNSIYEVREIGAQFASGVTVSTDDKVLVLSTCLAGNSQRRYLVLAVCQAEIE